ncbi:MAG: hypothetical protein ACRDMJ_13385 [Solirubrobacteraceae bacterium]
MPPASPRRRRARPVADAPLDALLVGSEELAKSWLVALLERSPLQDAPRIAAAELTRDGPRLCEAVLRALADDGDLRRLEAGGALFQLAGRAGELAGAVSPAGVSAAVDALQAVIWRELRDELRGPDPELVSDLAGRLALVAEVVRAAALERVGPAEQTDRNQGATVVAVPPSAPVRVAPDQMPRSWPAAAPTDQTRAPEALWIGALQDEIHRSAGGSLSLLLAELQDADRIESVEDGGVATATLGQFARAVRGAVRRRDILVCESDARAWVIARETSRTEARALAGRIAAAVRHAPAWRGAPLTATVGVAVLGEDGRTSGELIEAAEEARLDAASGGVDVALAGEREPQAPA